MSKAKRAEPKEVRVIITMDENAMRSFNDDVMANHMMGNLVCDISASDWICMAISYTVRNRKKAESSKKNCSWGHATVEVE